MQTFHHLLMIAIFLISIFYEEVILGKIRQYINNDNTDLRADAELDLKLKENFIKLCFEGRLTVFIYIFGVLYYTFTPVVDEYYFIGCSFIFYSGLIFVLIDMLTKSKYSKHIDIIDNIMTLLLFFMMSIHFIHEIYLTICT